MLSLRADQETMNFLSDVNKTMKFVESVSNILDHYQLDGFDLDYECPAYNQKNDFVRMLSFLRSEFNRKRSSNKTYALSVALSPIISIVSSSYNVAKISAFVDWVNLMTYDFHSPNTFPYTEHNSPLFANKLDRLYFKYFNINFAVTYFVKLGLRKKQIMVGIPFYGYKYFLVNKNFHDLYALSNGTQITIIYRDICRNFLNRYGTKKVFDIESKVPYAYNDLEWITYDDWESITIKAQWIVDNDLGGSMTFAINYDDYQSKCPQSIRNGKRQPFPLQTILYQVLN
ncbi:Chitinase-3-like protein 1 [Sarcoptes scabiei]|uniref:Chitinase-3-like protein 1 n=2 Tax=Sarcoptes scabiei TaxID=52283 RepID=A0A834VHL2_SARSC|nr:Chitinase-3-like protein 1 [Sarcoptes scabiei]